MTCIQCPVCKNQFAIELDISVKTRGLTVFRGRMDFLGNLEDVNALLDFVRSAFLSSPLLHKQTLIDKLVQKCGIPRRDAHHFVEKLQQEGFIYEQENDELVLIG